MVIFNEPYIEHDLNLVVDLVAIGFSTAEIVMAMETIKTTSVVKLCDNLTEGSTQIFMKILFQ